MEASWFTKEDHNGVSTITANRPDARNAMSREMVVRFTDYLLEIDDNPSIRCVVLRGTGGNFISGGDVSGFAKAADMTPAERRSEFRRRVAGLGLQMDLLNRLSKPVITLAEGSVAGAGVAYALASDYVIATTEARFVFAHVHLGLPLDSGLSYLLPRVVGLPQAKRLALTGATIDANEALNLGLVAEIAEPEDLNSALQRIQSHFLSLPPKALGAIKQQLDASISNGMHDQIGLEGELAGNCAEDEEFVRRITAFLNRTKKKQR